MKENEIKVGGASSPEEIVFLSENYQIGIKTFPNIEIGDVKPIKKKVKNENDTRRLLFIIFILVILEITGKMLWILFRPLVVISIILLVIYLYKSYGIRSLDYIRCNHGAEHKVINAHYKGNIDDADSTERISIGCGTNLAFPILVMVLLGDWIHYPFTLSIIYYYLYMNTRKFRIIYFNIIGKYIQLLVTKEPSSYLLTAAKLGFLMLIDEEKKLKN